MKITTSKRLLVISFVVSILLSLCVVVGTFTAITYDLSNLTIVCGSAWVETGAATGFYYWKAKNENRSKHAMELVNKFAKQYGIEAATRIAEVVLKD